MSCRSGESFVAEAADIVIIGGGVIGATIPLNFARRDIRDVMVVEKDFIAKDFIEIRCYWQKLGVHRSALFHGM